MEKEQEVEKRVHTMCNGWRLVLKLHAMAPVLVESLLCISSFMRRYSSSEVICRNIEVLDVWVWRFSNSFRHMLDWSFLGMLQGECPAACRLRRRYYWILLRLDPRPDRVVRASVLVPPRPMSAVHMV